jgi:hypothetical protein
MPAYAAAVEQPQRPGDDRRIHNLLNRDPVPQHGLRVARTIVVGLDRNLGQHPLALFRAQSVRGEILRGRQCIPADRSTHFRRCSIYGMPLARPSLTDAAESGVFHLFKTQRQNQVIGLGSQAQGRSSDGLSTGTAGILHAGHRNELQLQGTGENDPGHGVVLHGVSDPGRLDVLRRHIGVSKSLVGRIDYEVDNILVPELPKRGTPHANNGYFVLQALHRNLSLAPDWANPPEVVVQPRTLQRKPL